MGFYYSPKIVTDGLILALDAANPKSYPGSGTTTYDLSGNGNNGTLYNGVGYDQTNGGVLTFDGIDDYGSSPTSYPATWADPFTLEVWIKVDTGLTWYNQGSGTNILGAGSYAGSIGIFRASTNNQVNFWVRTNSNIFSIGTVITRDMFYNIVGVWDGVDTARIYNNRQLITSATSTNISGTPNGSFYRTMGNLAFGGSNGGYGAGDLAIAKVYNRALSASEITQNYNTLKGRFGL